MPNPKFHIWQGSELRASFYSSDHKELSIVDKRTICKVLKTSFETAWFAPTHESMLSLQLPEKPTFTNKEGRKYWILGVGEQRSKMRSSAFSSKS